MIVERHKVELETKRIQVKKSHRTKDTGKNIGKKRNMTKLAYGGQTFTRLNEILTKS